MRLLCFVGVLAILWLPLAIPLSWLLKGDPNLATIVVMGLLFVELLWLWNLWGRLVYQEVRIFDRYGMVVSRKNATELFKGLAIGFCLCLSLFIVEAWLGWITIVSPQVSLIKIVLEGLISALGIALAEELLFRGWLLDELRRDYQPNTCVWSGALIFALAHFIKPIDEIIRTAVTFPALVLLGISLIIAKSRHSNRLGICIGIHGGLVWGYYIVNVAELIQYSDRVPIWVTGIDNNPIASIMGLIFLSGLIVICDRLRG